MLDNLINLIRGNSNDAIVNNNVISNEKNEGELESELVRPI